MKAYTCLTVGIYRSIDFDKLTSGSLFLNKNSGEQEKESIIHVRVG